MNGERCEWCHGPWHLCACTGPVVTCEGCGEAWPVEDPDAEPFGYSVDWCFSCDEPPEPVLCGECGGRGVEPDSAQDLGGTYCPPDPCRPCGGTGTRTLPFDAPTSDLRPTSREPGPTQRLSFDALHNECVCAGETRGW